MDDPTPRPGFLVRAPMLALALMLAVCGARGAHAGQDSPPALDYPGLRITAGDDGLSFPATVAAGLTLVTVENTGTHDHSVYLLQPASGTSVADLIAMLTAPSTPGAEEEGPPVDFFQQTRWFGGPSLAAPGGRSQAILDLVPGEYAVLDVIGAGSNEEGWIRPLTVTAGAASPTAVAPPPAEATIEMREYAFAGLPERVAPGRHVWEVAATGPQPHELYVAKAPDGTTLEALMAALATPPDATPPADALDLEAITSVGGMAALSPGQRGWAVLDLEPGSYVAFCFVPDAEMGMPHAALGMAAVFTVDGATG